MGQGGPTPPVVGLDLFVDRESEVTLAVELYHIGDIAVPIFHVVTQDVLFRHGLVSFGFTCDFEACRNSLFGVVQGPIRIAAVFPAADVLFVGLFRSSLIRSKVAVTAVTHGVKGGFFGVAQPRNPKGVAGPEIFSSLTKLNHAGGYADCRLVDSVSNQHKVSVVLGEGHLANFTLMATHTIKVKGIALGKQFCSLFVKTFW